ncbi:MAG: L-serine ammonia-lyase, iron-sulfur-dependent subunit beta [Collinsella intestinalis]
MPAKPQSFATTSAFEVLGPIMVGPSSSHTAGALRCAQVAASLLDGRIVRVTFTLWNSFAHTYKGHGTNRALVAGVLGLDTDDERIRDAFTLAEERGLAYEFVIGGDDASIHPNTVDIHLESETGSMADVRGESLGGGKMRISAITACTSRSQVYTTLFVAHRDAPGALASLTGALAQAQMNIAFCRTYRTEAGGQAYSVFETDGAPQRDVLPIVRALDLVNYATFIELPGSVTALGPGISVPDLFDDAEQLLAACRELNMNIGGVMRVREERMVGAERAAANMRRVIEVMRDETTATLAQPQRSLGGFLNGEARRVDQNRALYAPSLLGCTLTEAAARAMAVLERSATIGSSLQPPLRAPASSPAASSPWHPCSPR